MAGIYPPRPPERTVLFRVMFDHFERFLTEDEGRFESGNILGAIFHNHVKSP